MDGWIKQIDRWLEGKKNMTKKIDGWLDEKKKAYEKIDGQKNI